MALATSELRSGLASLTTLAANDLTALWRTISTAAASGQALHDILPALIETYGAAAATLAADWYDDQRDKLGVARYFRAIPADIADTGAHALVGWALTEATDDSMLQSLILAGLDRRLAAFTRQTIMGSSVADPGAHGWQRQASGSACGFCQMLAGRGDVYSEHSADFAAHGVKSDGSGGECHCTAVPAFKGQPKPVKPYTPSLRYSDDDAGRAEKARDQAAVRDWLASH